MKLFKRICACTFWGTAVLGGGILVFLTAAMLRQGISDARSYGEEKIRSREYMVRESLRLEPGGFSGEVSNALIDAGFREMFGTKGVLWKDGKVMQNASPYEYDRDALEALAQEQPGGQKALFISRPQKVEGRRQIVFYQSRANFGQEGYSFVYYEDVTDIYARTKRLFLLGLGFGGVLLAAVLAVLYGVIRRILEPLQSLRGAAMRVARGVYDGELLVCGDDEIAAVTESFNCMAKQVRGQMETLSQSNEKQVQLLGSLSHEMKTPMTAIIGNADLLLTVRLGEQEQQQALGYILDEAKRLSRLSQKMMELTGLYARETSEIEMGQVRVETLLKRLERETDALLAKRQVALRVTCLPDSLEKRMDADLALSLFQNLVDNAAKASFKGSVISVTAEEEKICVRDAGAGIAKEKLPRVTEAFYMADPSRARRRGSLGLGLALCSRIAQLHGWEMRIESREGAGTTVSLFW